MIVGRDHVLLNPGDHVCALYDNRDQLADIVVVSSKLEQLNGASRTRREQSPAQPKDGRRHS
jgi:hypothetical protein